MRWLKPHLPSSTARVLLEGLEAACLEVGAAQAWALTQVAKDRYELIASLGPAAPTKFEFLFHIESDHEIVQKLRNPKLSGINPFPQVHEAVLCHRGKSILCFSAVRIVPAKLLDLLFLACERIQLEQEVHQLKSQPSESAKSKLAKTPAALPAKPIATPDLLPDLEPMTEDPPIRSWFRVAAGTLASGHLASVLPTLVQRLRQSTGLSFAAILIYEDRRVRLWGGEALRKILGPVFSTRKLGSLGRRVLEGGEIFSSNLEGQRLEKNQIFGQQLQLRTLVAHPLTCGGHRIGAIFLGDTREKILGSELYEQIANQAQQTSQFVDQALTRHAIDVERVVSKAVLESMADGVFTLDFEKRITSFNPAAEQITGWKAEQAIGRTCQEIFRPQYHCPVTSLSSTSNEVPTVAGPGEAGNKSCRENCPLVALLADQKLMDSGLTVEGSILTAEGETRYVSSTYSVVSQKEDLLGAVVLFRDITEKRAFEQMKSDYAAALSHDLKTPLTAMKGYAVTLLRHGTKLDAETRQDALEVINSEIDRVTRMFDNLLHQARIEAGQHARYIEGLPLSIAVKRVVNVHQMSSRRHQITFQVADGLIIRADRDQLDQILNNLVSNAVKYSPSGCSIHVSAAETGRMIEVRVTDTGNGIAADQLPFVFERFRRVQDRMNRNVSGSGLGLYITRMLVEGMEGEVGAESTPGQGSTFWFRLPAQR